MSTARTTIAVKFENLSTELSNYSSNNLSETHEKIISKLAADLSVAAHFLLVTKPDSFQDIIQNIHNNISLLEISVKEKSWADIQSKLNQVLVEFKSLETDKPNPVDIHALVAQHNKGTKQFSEQHPLTLGYIKNTAETRKPLQASTSSSCAITEKLVHDPNPKSPPIK